MSDLKKPVHCWYSEKAAKEQDEDVFRTAWRGFYLINGKVERVTYATSENIPPNWDDAIYLGEGTFHRSERISLRYSSTFWGV